MVTPTSRAMFSPYAPYTVWHSWPRSQPDKNGHYYVTNGRNEWLAYFCDGEWQDHDLSDIRGWRESYI